MEFVKNIMLGLIFCWAARVDGKPRAFYMFGDSTIDSGNNNQLKTVVKANFPPYGVDFPGRKATGRFTNGRLVTDMLFDLMGLSDELPAYLDANFKGEHLLNGTCFGSAGAGLDDTTSKPLGVMTISQQLDHFKIYKTKLARVVGKHDANKVIEGAFFGISMGTNDYFINYYNNPLTRAQYSVKQFQTRLLQDLESFIKGIYREGATKLMVIGLPPFGCLPAAITLHNLLNGTCVNEHNNVAIHYNNNLQYLLDSMKQTRTIPRLQLVYVDIYNKLLDMIQNPNRYGFEEVRKGCCGTGDIETGPLCNKLSNICQDVSKHLFWDSVHPTSRAYNFLAYHIFNQAKSLIV